ncbi:MAG: hypothetical protein C4576_14055 [Desulfobacteraceae bacterium]|nr:MAG: hypothetical protein C4576_14055 [Desulfobacteraceae bacterium]
MEKLGPIPNLEQIKQRIRDNVCPYCGSEDREYNEVEIDAKEARQITSCGKCGNHWTDVYIFYKVILSDAPEGQEFRVRMTESDPANLYSER